MGFMFTSASVGIPWMIRTDFSDQEAWETVCAAAATDPMEERDLSPEDVFGLVEDPAFEGLTADGLLSLEPDPHETYLLVDHVTVTHPELPILAVDVNQEPGRSFRLIPSEVSAFAASMMLGNLDFSDFADCVGDDGILRTFGRDRNMPVLTAPRPTVAADPHPGEAGPPMDDRASAPEDKFARTIPVRFGQQWPPDHELPRS